MKTPDTNGTRPLYVIVAGAVLLRLVAAWYLGNSVTTERGIFDEVSYHTLAVRVLDGHGFSFGEGWWPATPANEPTAHWSFLYVIYLTGVYALVGVNPIVVRILQALVMGIGTPLLVYRIGGRLFGRAAGLWGAAVAACYAYLIFYSAALLTEPFFVLAMLLAIDTALRLRASWHAAQRGPELGKWITLGASFAVAILLRQLALFAVPVVLGWLMFERRSSTVRVDATGSGPLLRRWTGPLAVVAIITLAVLPWTIRNYVAFREFVPLNTNAGFAFFWGNHPVHGNTFAPLLTGEDAYGKLIPAALRDLNEAQMDKALMREGIGFVIADPIRYGRLTLSRVKEFLKFWPTRESGAASNAMRMMSFGICLPFMVLGLALAFFGNQATTEATRASRHGTWLIALAVLEYSSLYVLTWTLVRYRLPVDALLMPFAGFALADLSARLFNVRHTAGAGAVASSRPGMSI